MTSWQDKKEWQGRSIEWHMNGIKYIWFFAFVWNAISAPAVFVGIPELHEKGEHWPILVICIFPLVGLMLICFAVYKTLQKLKYGSCSVTLESMPLSIGSKTRLTFSLPQKLIGTDTLRINLTNVRRKVSGTGKNRSVSHDILWRSVKNVSLKDARIRSGKLETEVEITIPYDCLEYDEADPKNQILWQLQLSAETPGIDFLAEFPLPVFKTEKSDPEVIGNEEDEQEVLAGKPQIKGIQMQEIPDGLRLFIKPFRFIGAAISTFILAVIFFGVGAGLVINDLWFGYIFAFVSLPVLSFSAHFLLIQTEIVFFKDQGQVKSTWLGMGFIKEFDLSVIKDIRPKMAARSHSDTSGDKCQYTIEIIPENGESLKLCELTKDYTQALWIAAKLKDYLKNSSLAADDNHS